MIYYGIKHSDGELFRAMAYDGESALDVALDYGLQYHKKTDFIDDSYFNKLKYQEITRKEFNDFFILQNKNMNQFIKEL